MAHMRQRVKDLLVINTNLAPIFYVCFRDTAFNGSKSLYSATPLNVFNYADGQVSHT